MVHLRHQEPAGKQPAEPGAGRRPGAAWPGGLLYAQGAGLPGGGAGRKPAAQTCEERCLKTKKKKRKEPLRQVLQISLFV